MLNLNKKKSSCGVVQVSTSKDFADIAAPAHHDCYDYITKYHFELDVDFLNATKLSIFFKMTKFCGIFLTN